jgi:hypothetical protein
MAVERPARRAGRDACLGGNLSERHGHGWNLRPVQADRKRPLTHDRLAEQQLLAESGMNAWSYETLRSSTFLGGATHG